MKVKIGLLVVSLLVLSCKPSADSARDLGFSLTPAKESQKNYSESVLAGHFLGKNWSAVSAVARPFGVDRNQIAIEFYDFVASISCNAVFPSQPYASIVLPKNITIAEYTFDLRNIKGNGEPVVFVDPKTNYNLVSEQTKLRVNSIDATGFEISLYVFAIDTTALTSEINGRIKVQYCK